MNGSVLIRTVTFENSYVGALTPDVTLLGEKAFKEVRSNEITRVGP